MVYTLTFEEVMKVCSACGSYQKDHESCRHDPLNVKPLKEMHRCKKWDEFFGGACIHHGTA
jgi:hypothetical protein